MGRPVLRWDQHPDDTPTPADVDEHPTTTAPTHDSLCDDPWTAAALGHTHHRPARADKDGDDAA